MLFPDPLGPTIAVVLFAGTWRLKFFRTWTSGREGYANETLWSSISPWHSSGLSPSGDRESILDLRSIVLKRSCAAAADLEMVTVWGAIWLIAWAATTTAKMTLGVCRTSAIGGLQEKVDELN